MLMDYHMHTPLCGHAVGEPKDYVEMALQRGLDEVGFSDHVILHVDRREYSMSLDQLPRYVQEVKALQQLFPNLPIKLGVEADYSPSSVEKIRVVLRRHSFDYVLGSVHSIGDWFFDDSHYVGEYQKRDIDQIYEEYFRLVQEAALSGLFDIIAHPDLIKKFGYKPKDDPRSLYEKTVEAFKNAGVCIEVNTSGLRKPVKEIYPNKGFLKLCLENRIPVTLGSDAHQPKEVGQDLEKAVSLLKSVGYKELALFTERKRKYAPL